MIFVKLVCVQSTESRCKSLTMMWHTFHSGAGTGYYASCLKDFAGFLRTQVIVDIVKMLINLLIYLTGTMHCSLAVPQLAISYFTSVVPVPVNVEMLINHF